MSGDEELHSQIALDTLFIHSATKLVKLQHCRGSLHYPPESLSAQKWTCDFKQAVLKSIAPSLYRQYSN